MAKVNLTLPNLEIDKLSDSQVIRKIASYLYIQNEQLRYELTHIDEDNMSSENQTQVQGMTQAQVQKAIEEAAKNNTQNIDLSSNTIIVNLQRRLDNLGKLQNQDANNISKLTTEVNKKVSTTTYNSGMAGLKALIDGNTNLIGGLNQNFGILSTAYYNHKHQISINNTTGVISIGGPTASVTNPNISATAYFRNAVAEARQNGERQGQREWQPDQIVQDGDKITILNAAGDTIGGPYAIDVSQSYNSGWNDCIDAAQQELILHNYTNYGGGRAVELFTAGGTSAGTHVWRYGGTTAYRYTLPAKK